MSTRVEMKTQSNRDLGMRERDNSDSSLSPELDLGDKLPLVYKHDGSRVGGALVMLYAGVFVPASLAA